MQIIKNRKQVFKLPEFWLGSEFAEILHVEENKKTLVGKIILIGLALCEKIDDYFDFKMFKFICVHEKDSFGGEGSYFCKFADLLVV